MKNFILSCDWGTSSFRLRLVDCRNHQIEAEIWSDEGSAAVYNKWKLADQPRGLGRIPFYFRELQKHIDGISDKVSRPLTGISIVISGMASSSIGIKELPYAALPFSLDGNDAIVDALETENDFPFPVLLVSGIRTRNDVMRGEETQMIGLASLTAESGNDQVVCILPGTHAKHMKTHQGKLIDFKTYMTGELFKLLSRDSILKESISADSSIRPLRQEDVDAFQLGVIQSGKSDLLNTLFSVRTNQLFQLLTKEENFHYLSGLLIGAELNNLKRQHINHIQLCSESNLHELYRLGLEQLDLLERTVFVSPEMMRQAIVEAHIKIFKNHQ